MGCFPCSNLIYTEYLNERVYIRVQSITWLYPSTKKNYSFDFELYLYNLDRTSIIWLRVVISQNISYIFPWTVYYRQSIGMGSKQEQEFTAFLIWIFAWFLKEFWKWYLSMQIKLLKSSPTSKFTHELINDPNIIYFTDLMGKKTNISN